MRARPVVAIDGPSGSGKSTVGKRVAVRTGFDYVDTGAMYRAVALRLLAEVEPEAALGRAGAIARACRIETAWDGATSSFTIRLDGRDVTQAVRGPEATAWASRVAAVPAVREVLVGLQRDRGSRGGVVMEGRDIGTVVFPDAEFKFFLDADLGVRGRRREREEGRLGGQVVREIAERDRIDSTRAVAPLRPAADAVSIDTTGLDLDEVVERVLARLAAGGLAARVKAR
jgi:cytidylate kinase